LGVRAVLGYVLAFRPLSNDGTIVTPCGRRFVFAARGDDTAPRGGDWIHFEPYAHSTGPAPRARIVARADRLASAWVTGDEAAELLTELARSYPLGQPV
jgi:hypothetical protein